jgi:cysteine desulfurase / selenocysteine lyase
MGPPDAPAADVRAARGHFPATERLAYFNTAAVGLASRDLIAAYHAQADDLAGSALDYARGEAAAEQARATVARLIGADPADVALIASVSAAAGLVASQFGPAAPGQNVVIGEREYSSNHFPWRLLEHKGYDVRQAAFRNGGIELDELARHVDRDTVLVAFSAVQTATGHRSDIQAISAIARAVDALVFVDASQLVGSLPVADDLDAVDILAAPDHKFLLNAARGVGYCYLSHGAQERFVPVNAGWKAGRVPLESFFGPTMELSPTASPVRRRRRLRAQPRVGRAAQESTRRLRLGPARPAGSEPQRNRLGSTGRLRSGARRVGTESPRCRLLGA